MCVLLMYIKHPVVVVHFNIHQKILVKIQTHAFAMLISDWEYEK